MGIAAEIELISLDADSLRNSHILEEMAIIYMIAFSHRELAEGFEFYFGPHSYWLARSESPSDEERAAWGNLSRRRPLSRPAIDKKRQYCGLAGTFWAFIRLRYMRRRIAIR